MPQVLEWPAQPRPWSSLIDATEPRPDLPVHPLSVSQLHHVLQKRGHLALPVQRCLAVPHAPGGVVRLQLASRYLPSRIGLIALPQDRREVVLSFDFLPVRQRDSLRRVEPFLLPVQAPPYSPGQYARQPLLKRLEQHLFLLRGRKPPVKGNDARPSRDAPVG